MDPTISPETLQNKVQFDIRFYFCERANENIEKFTKDTFIVQLNPDTNIRYVVKKIDELTKNHREGSVELVSACMPELQGSENYPVANFECYVKHLNPKLASLWQCPKTWENIGKSGNPTVWYCNSPITTQTLGAFMSKLSHAADLSRVYTNHSIWATGCPFLHRTNFSPKQIMSVTGHHSLNSQAIYEKVSTNEKLSMGMCMTYYLTTDNITSRLNVPLQRTQPRPILPKLPPSAALGKPDFNPALPNISHMPLHDITDNMQLVPAKSVSKNLEQKTPSNATSNVTITHTEQEDPLQDENWISDVDLMSYISDIQNEEQEAMVMTQQNTINSKNNSEISTTTTSIQCTVKRSPNNPVFNNCKIGNITINIAK